MYQVVRRGSPYILIKEIQEQPTVVERIVEAGPGPYREVAEMVAEAERVFIVGSGSSYHAGLFLDILLRGVGIDSRAVISSEYRTIEGLVKRGSLVIAVSQSGSTRDTLEAVTRLRSLGARIVGVTNIEKSPLTEVSEKYIVVGAGREEAVTATKSFTGQVVSLARVYTELLRIEGRGEAVELEKTLKTLPTVVRRHIYRSEVSVRGYTEHVFRRDKMYVLGRELEYVSALESALKIKETCGIHAEAVSLSEIRHGPKATVDSSYIVSIVIGGDRDLETAATVMSELRDSGAVFLVTAPDTLSEKVERPGDTVLFMNTTPGEVPRELRPIFSVVVHQLLAYYIAVARALDPDFPRRLSKVVL